MATRAVIRGQVQGVGYRLWLSRQAGALGIGGWVRNRLDGSVEATFSGQADAVAALIARCRRGPPAARVDQIEIDETQGPAWEDFRQLPTV